MQGRNQTTQRKNISMYCKISMSSNETIEDLEQYMNIDKNKLENYISKYGINDEDHIKLKMYSLNKSDPFTLNNNQGKLNNIHKLNKLILALYEYIKKYLRSFDNAFANFRSSMPYTNDEELNEKFYKIVNYLIEKKDINSSIFTGIEEKDRKKLLNFLQNEQNEENEFDYYLYELASLLRYCDGHKYNKDENRDNDENYPFNHDYPFIEQLKKLILQKDESLLSTILSNLSHCGSNYFTPRYYEIGVSADVYFLFLYNLALATIINKKEQLMKKSIIRQLDTKIPVLSHILQNNDFLGGKQSKRMKIRGKQSKRMKIRAKHNLEQRVL
jgi:hypothetical protein